MYIDNKRSIRVVKQLKKDILTIVWILLLNSCHIWYAFMYIFYNCYSLLLGYFRHLWPRWSWQQNKVKTERCSIWNAVWVFMFMNSCALQLLFVKLIHVKTKQKCIEFTKFKWLTCKTYISTFPSNTIN